MIVQHEIIDLAALSKEEKYKAMIIEGALREFFRFGYSKVSMNELATQLGISKKTIYKYFPSKEDLFLAALDYRQNYIMSKVGPIMCSNLTYFEKLVKSGNFLSQVIANTPIQLLQDVQRNAPHIFRLIQQRRKDNILSGFSEFIKQGQKLGMIRNDIPAELVCHMYIILMESLFTQEILINKNWKPDEIYQSIVKVMFDGLVVDEFRDVYHKISDVPPEEKIEENWRL